MIASFSIRHSRSENEPFRGIDFVENARHGVNAAVRSTHMNEDRAPWFRIYLADGVCKPFRAPPFCQALWFSPRFKHQLSWCIEYAFKNNFLFGRTLSRSAFNFTHVYLLLGSFPDILRADPGFRPSPGSSLRDLNQMFFALPLLR